MQAFHAGCRGVSSAAGLPFPCHALEDEQGMVRCRGTVVVASITRRFGVVLLVVCETIVHAPPPTISVFSVVIPRTPSPFRPLLSVCDSASSGSLWRYVERDLHC